MRLASRSRSRWRVAPVATLAGTLACIPGREPEGRELTRSPGGVPLAGGSLVSSAMPATGLA